MVHCLPDFSVTKASTTNETRETPVPKTPEAMRKMFDVHVPYEIIRLDEMYRLMAQPDLFNFKGIPEKQQPTIEDALIVAFCSHARNLVEFFEKQPSDNYACAKDFAKDKYEPLKINHGTRLHSLKGMLNNQINHLTYERTDQPDEKIGAPERKELFQAIHDEVVRWKAALKPEYDVFTINTDSLADARVMVLKAAIGESNEITHSTSPSISGTTTILGS